MQTIAIDLNNDLYIDSSGNIALNSDLEAMGDIYVNKVQTVRGELLYNSEKGIDFFDTIFSSPAYLDLFQNQLFSQIEDTEATQKIESFSSKNEKNIYSYTAKIQTNYGQVTLNG